jgi:galacturan 1,4-alpha-galacturonidase
MFERKMFMKSFLRLAVLFSLAAINSAALNKTGSDCVVTPLGGTSDDTPQILDAFKQCGKDGSITLSEGTFNIGQVMDKLDFQNCDIHIYGTLIWSTDIQYWLFHSISVVYAGRSTACTGTCPANFSQQLVRIRHLTRSNCPHLQSFPNQAY